MNIYDDDTVGARAVGDVARPQRGDGTVISDVMRELAAWAEARLSRLIDDAYAAIINRMDLYHTDEIVPRDDLRRSLANNLEFMIAAIADPQAPLDLTAPAETGRRRAHQGMPLPEVLRAYRIGFATLWDALAEHARDEGRPDAESGLIEAAGMIWQLTDEHALAITEAHRAATAEMLVAQQRRRSALVEALFTGAPGPQGSPWEAARLLGLPPDASLVVVAAETHGLAEESLVGAERRLADQGFVSAWRLSPALQLGVVAIDASESGKYDELLGVLREVATARAGVSPLYRSLTDTPRALQLARVALAGIPSGKPEVHTFSPSPLAALMAREPDEGNRLSEEVLGPVLDLPADDRAVLLETLHAYLDHGGSADRAAEVLYCHPNTVRYRLRRLSELTGRSLTDPRELAELATAAYALDVMQRQS